MADIYSTFYFLSCTKADFQWNRLIYMMRGSKLSQTKARGTFFFCGKPLHRLGDFWNGWVSWCDQICSMIEQFLRLRFGTIRSALWHDRNGLPCLRLSLKGRSSSVGKPATLVRHWNAHTSHISMAKVWFVGNYRSLFTECNTEMDSLVFKDK